MTLRDLPPVFTSSFSFQSLRTRLTLLLLVVGFLPLVVGTAVSLEAYRTALYTEAQHELDLRTSRVIQGLEALLDRIQSNLQITAHNPAFLEPPDAGPFSLSVRRQVLEALLRAFPGMAAAAYWVDPEGHIQVFATMPPDPSWPPPATPLLWPIPAGSIFVQGPPVRSSGGFWVVPFVSPVWTPNGALRGSLHLELALDDLGEALKQTLAPEEHALVIERSGTILAQTILFIGQSPLLPRVDELDPSPQYRTIIQRVIHGHSGHATLTTSRGWTWWVAYQPTSLGAWSVMVLIPEKILFPQSFPLGGLPIIFGGTLILILALALSLGQRISRPLRDLLNGTRILGQGEFGHRIPEGRRDEIGELARAFNAMAARLQDRDREVQSLVSRLESANRDLKATQAQLIQSAKLAAVGELAAGVAHELNQPLMVIRGYAQELLQEPQSPEDMQEGLQQIERQTSRMMCIITHLRDFARKSPGASEPVQLNDVIQGAFTFLSQQLRHHNIAIHLNLASNLPPIWGDPNRLEQIFVNLITNARDAMDPKGGGTLRVQSRLVNPDPALEGTHAPVVEVCFEDTGVGIPQEHQERIFDPFFTTKEAGRGTGLGLSITYNIVQDHGGNIRVESQPGQGTRFILRFPMERRRHPRVKLPRTRTHESTSREVFR